MTDDNRPSDDGEDMVDTVRRVALLGLTVEGAHHKQWCLEEILRTVNDVDRLRETYDWAPGIAP